MNGYARYSFAFINPVQEELYFQNTRRPPQRLQARKPHHGTILLKNLNAADIEGSIWRDRDDFSIG
jgi:hypothetical protein